MLTDVQMVNIGLAKIGQSRVTNITAPVTSLERFVSSQYTHWKRLMLSKHKWVFARVNGYPLTIKSQVVGAERPYEYGLPTECLKPIRTRETEWKQAGRSLFSAHNTLSIDFIKNVNEADFDTWFTEVFACKIALECVDYVTQSNVKKADAKSLLDEALAEAKRENAFVVGPEDYGNDDYSFEFIRERFL